MSIQIALPGNISFFLHLLRSSSSFTQATMSTSANEVSEDVVQIHPLSSLFRPLLKFRDKFPKYLKRVKRNASIAPSLNDRPRMPPSNGQPQCVDSSSQAPGSSQHVCHYQTDSQDSSMRSRVCQPCYIRSLFPMDQGDEADDLSSRMHRDSRENIMAETSTTSGSLGGELMPHGQEDQSAEESVCSSNGVASYENSCLQTPAEYYTDYWPSLPRGTENGNEEEDEDEDDEEGSGIERVEAEIHDEHVFWSTRRSTGIEFSRAMRLLERDSESSRKLFWAWKVRRAQRKERAEAAYTVRRCFAVLLEKADESFAERCAVAKALKKKEMGLRSLKRALQRVGHSAESLKAQSESLAAELESMRAQLEGRDEGD